jgi:hypothetical protein
LAGVFVLMVVVTKRMRMSEKSLSNGAIKPKRVKNASGKPGEAQTPFRPRVVT